MAQRSTARQILFSVWKPLAVFLILVKLALAYYVYTSTAQTYYSGLNSAKAFTLGLVALVLVERFRKK
jgi:hypothetical protein